MKDFAPSVGRAVTFQNKGTAFYIGKHNGEYLVATNAHVLTNVPFCQMGPMLSPRFYFEDFADGLYCRQIIGSWKEIDLAIISLRVSRDQEYFFDRKEEFKFHKSASVDKFTELVTFGHGEVNNPSYKLTYDDSSDCKVLSQTNRFRSVLKEDDPLKHKIPSFATGCDISRGDSGSPVIDKSNGTLLGIIWGTRNKKPLKIKSSAYIHLLSEQNHEDIWKYMSYAIPTKEIFDRVEKSVRNDRMRYKNRLILQLLFDIRN
ncbi:serine protease [Bacteriovoracaceae bacterium]|nr:serine protease [Bacteriovoracaceae bacterium]